MSRSIPLDKALDDVLLAYGQNGEALRPEQGNPLRLVVPGWEGNVNIKIVLGDFPVQLQKSTNDKKVADPVGSGISVLQKFIR